MALPRMSYNGDFGIPCERCDWGCIGISQTVSPQLPYLCTSSREIQTGIPQTCDWNQKDSRLPSLYIGEKRLQKTSFNILLKSGFARVAPFYKQDKIMHFYVNLYLQYYYHLGLPCNCCSTFFRTSSCLWPIKSRCGVMSGLVGMKIPLSIYNCLSELLLLSSRENLFPFSFRSFFKLKSLLLRQLTAIVSNLRLRAAMMEISSRSGGETSLRFLPSAFGFPLPLNFPILRKESSKDVRLLCWMSFSRTQQWVQSISPLMGGSLSQLMPCGNTLSTSILLFLEQDLCSPTFLRRSSSSMLRRVFLAYSSMLPFLSRHSWTAQTYFLNLGKEGGGAVGKASSSGGSMLQGEKQLALMMDFNYFICIIILWPCIKNYFKHIPPSLLPIPNNTLFSSQTRSLFTKWALHQRMINYISAPVMLASWKSTN